MDIWFTSFVFFVAIAASIGCVLLLVGHIDTIPAAIAHGWRWGLLALLVPVFGPLWFARRHWQECAKPGKQLLAGLALLILAVALLYGAGPHFIGRILAGVK